MTPDFITIEEQSSLCISQQSLNIATKVLSQNDGRRVTMAQLDWLLDNIGKMGNHSSAECSLLYPISGNKT